MNEFSLLESLSTLSSSFNSLGRLLTLNHLTLSKLQVQLGSTVICFSGLNTKRFLWLVLFCKFFFATYVLRYGLHFMKDVHPDNIFWFSFAATSNLFFITTSKRCFLLFFKYIAHFYIFKHIFGILKCIIWLHSYKVPMVRLSIVTNSSFDYFSPKAALQHMQCFCCSIRQIFSHLLQVCSMNKLHINYVLSSPCTLFSFFSPIVFSYIAWPKYLYVFYCLWLIVHPSIHIFECWLLK